MHRCLLAALLFLAPAAMAQAVTITNDQLLDVHAPQPMQGRHPGSRLAPNRAKRSHRGAD
jgi:hypothetical protein